MDGRNVLLIDDEIHVVSILRRKFEQAGCAVRVAKNGREGLTAVAESRPDLIVIDYQMPVMDGVEAVAELASDAGTASIPVIMLTARGHQARDGGRLTANVRRLLPKPFSSREVIRMAEELLSEAEAGAAEGGAGSRAA